MITAYYKISGKVQRVAYRAFVRDKAQQLGIVGWVRNLKDGSVECLACADGQSLEEFEKQLEKGPKWAKVDQVEKEIMTETCESDRFEVAY